MDKVAAPDTGFLGEDAGVANCSFFGELLAEEGFLAATAFLGEEGGNLTALAFWREGEVLASLAAVAFFGEETRETFWRSKVVFRAIAETADFNLRDGGRPLRAGGPLREVPTT